MLSHLGTWPLPIGFVLVVGGFTGASVIGASLVHRYASHQTLREHNDLSGFILAVVGVVYGVLLGFAAIGVWERFDLAEVRSYDEAASLVEAYRDADFFPGTGTRADMRAYVESIVSSDWPAMARGESSPSTRQAFERIARDVRRLPVRTYAQANAQQQMLSALSSASSGRDARLSMQATGLHPVMWFVLVCGGFITMGFTFLFGFIDRTLRVVMIGSLALMISLVLFLVMSLDHPFRGGITVEPKAFEHAITTFSIIDKTK